jgi:hypothetical protein
MFMPVKSHWHIEKSSYTLPILEFSCFIETSFEIPASVYLQIGSQMINLIEQYSGIVIEPFNNIPQKANIFFTVKFESFEDFRKFANETNLIRID